MGFFVPSSYGVVLWQILTGSDPVTDRRRYVRGGDRCPPAVADLLMQCLDRNPAARPSAGKRLCLLTARRLYKHAIKLPLRLADPAVGHTCTQIRLPLYLHTTGELVALLSKPESELPPALASRPGTQPPAGVPVCAVSFPCHTSVHACF